MLFSLLSVTKNAISASFNIVKKLAFHSFFRLVYFYFLALSSDSRLHSKIQVTISRRSFFTINDKIDCQEEK